MSPIQIIEPPGSGAAPYVPPKNLIIGGASESVATIEIPRLSGSLDVATPITGNGALSDDFDQNTSGAPSGWTAMNAPTVLDTNDVLSHLHVKLTGSANLCAGAYKSLAGAAYPLTITARISDMLQGTNSQLAGIFVSPVLPGVAGTAVGVLCASGGNVQNGSINMATGAYTGTTNGITFDMPLWLRLVLSANNAVQASGSRGGAGFFNCGSNMTPSAGVAYLLAIVCPQGAATGAEAFFDYVHCS